MAQGDDNAMEEQWEYCQLHLWNVSGYDKRRDGQQFSITVDYIGEWVWSESIGEIPGYKETFWGYNVFAAAIGLLGRAGWEMVSLQYPMSGTPASFVAGGLIQTNRASASLITTSANAFFKRRVAPDRQTNEPHLVPTLEEGSPTLVLE